ncbi:MAG TPA: DEAD/DEAH box helicase [Candidatus Saccharimonadales bacterium]|nr:DEAD/DEAH box helicase [Candidatus Saccharimonadales bacterium]
MPYASRTAYSSRSQKFKRGNTMRARHFGGATRPKKRGNAKQYIHPSKFVQAAQEIKQEVYVPQHAFTDFAFQKLIHDNIAKKGYVIPSPIQDQTIPLGLEGRDVIGLANTGTGKTAAFLLPILSKLISSNSRAIIIAPTRELAQQIEEEFASFAKGSGLAGALLIGGAPMGKQLRELKCKPAIVFGTPGRIKDHTERGSLDLSKFDIAVLDEVDRMLDMGFVHDITTLLNQTAQPRQSLFYSATMDDRVAGLSRQFLRDPVTVSVVQGHTSANVEQDVVYCKPEEDKLSKLHDLLLAEGADKVLIFDDTQRSVERLSKKLIDRGFAAESIHGGKTQGQRQRALRRFKANEITVLVATDVAARGIDVHDITHVINYSQPNSYDDYVHRVGRAGRAGRKGFAFTFVD